MWKKTADVTIRTVLLISVSSFGIAPVSASVLPGVDLSGAMKSGNIPAADLPELGRIILAQTVDHPQSDHNVSKDGHDRDTEILLNRATTRKIVLDLASIKKECSNYDEIYRIDCLRQGIDMMVATLPDNSEYRDAKRILRRASLRLGRIVSNYQDPTVPKLEALVDANPRFKKRRKYTAVRRADIVEAMAKAQKAVDEASTALLRSSENSERRLAHYQEISVAVDSTKVLLRSS